MGVKCIECSPESFVTHPFKVTKIMTDSEQEDFERRLAGLEKLAEDVTGKYRACIASSFQRHEERLNKLELEESIPDMRSFIRHLWRSAKMVKVIKVNADPSLDT